MKMGKMTNRAHFRIASFTSVVGNFALLIPLLYLLRASVAVAVTWIALDIITTALYYAFYRRHSVQYVDAEDRTERPTVID